MKWATGDAEQLGITGHELSSAAEVVYDILMADPAYAPEWLPPVSAADRGAATFTFGSECAYPTV